jgi:hypothetical protein
MAHRGQWSEHEARSVLIAWRKSGLSIERFAKERGLVPQRIRWWRTKLEDQSTALVRSPSALTLLPVQVTDAAPTKRGEKVKPIGNGRTTTVYEFVPARFVRHEHVQEVLRCRCGDYVVTAPGAPKVIEKGRYGASLLAHLAVAKCADHLPLPPREGLRSSWLPAGPLDDERSPAPDQRADKTALAAAPRSDPHAADRRR